MFVFQYHNLVFLVQISDVVAHDLNSLNFGGKCRLVVVVLRLEPLLCFENVGG